MQVTKSSVKSYILRGLVFLLMLPFFYSCIQQEGYGGTSGIEGVLMTKYFNDDYSVLIKEEPAVDEDVFILFGEEDFLGDKVATSVTGAFEFPFLNEGDYRLYYMSVDTASVSNEEGTVIIDLSLKSGKTTDLDTIYRFEVLNFDDGSGKLSGVVKLINYKNDTFYPFLDVKDITFAQEQEVYLVYGDHEFYDERIRTNFDGYFEFDNLIPGDYSVFVYSEDITGGSQDIEIVKNATITEEGEAIDMGEFIIEKL